MMERLGEDVKVPAESVGRPLTGARPLTTADLRCMMKCVLIDVWIMYYRSLRSMLFCSDAHFGQLRPTKISCRATNQR